MAKEKSFTPKYGEWAFLLGVFLALIIGVFASELGSATIYVLGILVVLGLLVGFLNIGEEETVPFLVATIALLTVSGSWAPISGMLVALAGDFGTLVAIKLSGFLSSLAAFVAPAALIVSLKQIYDLARGY